MGPLLRQPSGRVAGADCALDDPLDRESDRDCAEHPAIDSGRPTHYARGMPSIRLGTALIFVKDLKRMTDFYHEALGLPVIAAPMAPGWVEFDAGAVRLALHAIPPRIARQIEITNPPRAREETPIKLLFEVDDLGEVRHRLVHYGATMFEPKTSGVCDGLDPEGNVFSLIPRAE
jgi:predicted enzyme related to lactoylglutathione lyase